MLHTYTDLAVYEAVHMSTFFLFVWLQIQTRFSFVHNELYSEEWLSCTSLQVYRYMFDQTLHYTFYSQCLPHRFASFNVQVQYISCMELLTDNNTQYTLYTVVNVHGTTSQSFCEGQCLVVWDMVLLTSL